MARRPIVAGNWKMYKSLQEASDLTRGVLKAISGVRGLDIVLCPPFTALSTVGHLLKGPYVSLGAQDCHWESEGAFTGEVSPTMIKDAGARYCIIGHSERRLYFGETNQTVARKVQAVFAHALTPIVCIGETVEERQGGRTVPVIEEQLRVGLQCVPATRAVDLVLAYEPIWAIGTGQNATPTQAQEIHAFLRQALAKLLTPDAAQAIRIQYGGSVKPANSAALIAQPDIDGFLVGGASLDVDHFTAIVKAVAGRPTTKEPLCTPSS